MTPYCGIPVGLVYNNANTEIKSVSTPIKYEALFSIQSRYFFFHRDLSDNAITSLPEGLFATLISLRFL